MKTAAIVIDDWKLPIFEKILSDEGYKYTRLNGPAKDCITLKVETVDLSGLAPVVEKMNAEAAKSKLN